MVDNKMLRVVMYPWFAYGHMIPFLHLSNKLAESGHKVTFILPPKALPRLQNLNSDPAHITFRTITVPHVEELPLGAENVTDISDIDLHTHLATAMDRTRPEFESIVEGLGCDVMMYDVAYWVADVAKKVGAKSVAYNVVSAASVSLSKSVADRVGIKVDKPMTDEERKKKFAQYPHLIQLYGPFGEEVTSLVQVTLPEESGFRRRIARLRLPSSGQVSFLVNDEAEKGTLPETIAGKIPLALIPC